MGTYLLCGHSLSKSPFYVESVHLNIFSLEELCYFLSGNLPLAEEVIKDKELSIWLKKETALCDAVKEYDALDMADGNISDRLEWIFVKSRYFTENELRTLKYKIRALENMSFIQRQKKKADTLIKHKQYKRSILCYEEIFSLDGIDKEPDSFRSDICYNMGVASAKLFQSGKAMEYFYKAYEYEKSALNVNTYLYAAYFDGGEEKMLEEAKKLGVRDSTVASLLIVIKDIKPYEKPEDTDKAINKWIHEYHMSVGQ